MGTGADIKEYFKGNPKDFNINKLGTDIAGILLVIGYGIAVIMILYIGIKYMVATPAKRAQLKVELTYILVGVFILISGTTILGIIGGAFSDWGSQLNSSSSSSSVIHNHEATIN